MTVEPWFIVVWSLGILAYGLWIGLRVGRIEGRTEELIAQLRTDDDVKKRR